MYLSGYVNPSASASSNTGAPAVWREVAVRSPRGIDLPVGQQQSGPFLILSRSERRGAGAIRRRSRNLRRPIEQLGTRGDIQGVQALMIVRGFVDRHPHDVQNAMRAGGPIDHGRRSDADLGRHLGAAVRVARSFTVGEYRYLPDRSARVCIDGVHGAVLRSYEGYIVCRSGDGHLRKI